MRGKEKGGKERKEEKGNKGRKGRGGEERKRPRNKFLVMALPIELNTRKILVMST